MDTVYTVCPIYQTENNNGRARQTTKLATKVALAVFMRRGRSTNKNLTAFWLRSAALLAAMVSCMPDRDLYKHRYLQEELQKSKIINW